MPNIIEAKAKIGPVEPESVSEKEETCFIIMPFGEPFDRYCEDIYKPAISEAGLFPIRADDIFRPGDIISDIWKLTYEARVVLADLTGKNPNVFYELGLAQAIRKPVILITQSNEDIPFDLRPQRHIEYDIDESDWEDTLGKKITKYIKNTLDAPLEEVLPSFLGFDELSKEVISSSAADRMIEDLVKGELSNNSIIHEMRKYGVSRSYTMEKVYKIKDELSDT